MIYRILFFKNFLSSVDISTVRNFFISCRILVYSLCVSLLREKFSGLLFSLYDFSDPRNDLFGLMRPYLLL